MFGQKVDVKCLASFVNSRISSCIRSLRSTWTTGLLAPKRQLEYTEIRSVSSFIAWQRVIFLHRQVVTSEYATQCDSVIVLQSRLICQTVIAFIKILTTKFQELAIRPWSPKHSGFWTPLSLLEPKRYIYYGYAATRPSCLLFTQIIFSHLWTTYNFSYIIIGGSTHIKVAGGGRSPSRFIRISRYWLTGSCAANLSSKVLHFLSGSSMAKITQSMTIIQFKRQLFRQRNQIGRNRF